jgi:hypothetical protein
MGTIGKNEKAPILYPPKAKVTRSNRVGCAIFSIKNNNIKIRRLRRSRQFLFGYHLDTTFFSSNQVGDFVLLCFEAWRNVSTNQAIKVHVQSSRVISEVAQAPRPEADQEWQAKLASQ